MGLSKKFFHKVPTPINLTAPYFVIAGLRAGIITSLEIRIAFNIMNNYIDSTFEES